jgi:hypothetical protein
MSGSVSIDITETYILSALRSYLISVLPSGTEVVKGQINRVPAPTSPSYVVMTMMMRERLDTTTDTYQDNVTTGFQYSQVSTEFTIQCDFHGLTSGDMAQIVSTLFRDHSANDFFSTVTVGGVNMTCQPLYTSDPRQMPFYDDQGQVEYRQSVDICLQANPTVTQVQQFAASLQVGVFQVDATYPP